MSPRETRKRMISEFAPGGAVTEDMIAMLEQFIQQAESSSVKEPLQRVRQRLVRLRTKARKAAADATAVLVGSGDRI
jgi:hypothetical protein